MYRIIIFVIEIEIGGELQSKYIREYMYIQFDNPFAIWTGNAHDTHTHICRLIIIIIIYGARRVSSMKTFIIQQLRAQQFIDHRRSSANLKDSYLCMCVAGLGGRFAPPISIYTPTAVYTNPRASFVRDQQVLGQIKRIKDYMRLSGGAQFICGRRIVCVCFFFIM